VAQPITYEDFLPVSAAGIFQSNLGDETHTRSHGNASREAFERRWDGRYSMNLVCMKRPNCAVNAVAVCFKTGTLQIESKKDRFMQNASTRVETQQGTLSGVVDGDIHLWRGIPYAAAPVGALRWRAPQPVTPWGGVRQAAHFPASSWQNSEYCVALGAAIRAIFPKIASI
jgi:hypothetical protein